MKITQPIRTGLMLITRLAELGCLLACASTWAQGNSGLLPLDPAAQGYRVDNNVLPFKEQHSVLSGLLLSNGKRIDDRRVIANLVRDKSGDYEKLPRKKIVIADTVTGEIRDTGLEGNLDCYADGRVAIWYAQINDAKKLETLFFMGKLGSSLTQFPLGPNGQPPGTVVNKLSCELMPFAAIPQALKDGRRIDSRERLKIEHGLLAVVRGVPLNADTSAFPPALQNLMSQPFMRGMGVMSLYEEWFLIKPDGSEIQIPNNPGEAAVHYAKVTYLPYQNAYFIPPYMSGRPFDPDELHSTPKFARLLNGDGKVERWGVPDVIWEPYVRKQLVFNTYYTKKGLVWAVAIPDKNYTGPLTSGTYLDDRSSKVLRLLPKNRLVGGSPPDGCTIPTRTEVAQRYPYILNDYYFINICDELK
jgi:hypothetical protein